MIGSEGFAFFWFACVASPFSIYLMSAPSASPVDVGLGGEPRDHPAGEDEFSGCEDLSVSGQVDVLRFLPPPDVPLSGAQTQFCTEAPAKSYYPPLRRPLHLVP